MTLGPRAPLLGDVSQYEVDFVIPRAGIDIPLGIDPFLLFKSRDPVLSSLHTALLGAFNSGIDAIKSGRIAEARRILAYPEVEEIGLGYARSSKRGSGLGEYLTELLIASILDTPDLLAGGVTHIEEMQLVSVGIGPDRVSDIAANVLKQFLVEYTQRQCALWNIPMTSGVPLQHIWDATTGGWFDAYVDLPRSPADGTSMLFVPRRLVRALPWINYDDFLRLEFQVHLRAKRVRKALGTLRQDQPVTAPHHQHNKPDIVEVSRQEYERVRRFVAVKEAAAAEAQPSLEYLDVQAACPEADRLVSKLTMIATGQAQAAEYQLTVLEILNTCFNPELIDGKLEVATVEGTERRDIIFLNDSDRTFWRYLSDEHSNFLIMFETKNKAEIIPSDLNQTAGYLGDRLGRFGVIVTRSQQTEANERKSFSLYNDSHPRKVILVLSDQDLIEMLQMVCRGRDPAVLVRDRYRTFRERVQ